MNPNRYFLFLSLFFLLVLSCDNAELPPVETPVFCEEIEVPFYNTSVKKIFDESCAYSDCHRDNGVPGANYQNYAVISLYLSNEARMEDFRRRVIGDLKDHPSEGMPPSKSAYPWSLKEELTEEELQIIECWLDAGFPEG